jgi:hypothetical protein
MRNELSVQYFKGFRPYFRTLLESKRVNRYHSVLKVIKRMNQDNSLKQEHKFFKNLLLSFHIMLINIILLLLF